jgi:DNA-directed RNA polymerase specialized sigma24 family protein
MPPSSFVPKDFTEMYERYYVYVLRLVVRQGIAADDADDAAQYIFIKLMEANLLEQFDPDRVHFGRKAVFGTLLSSFVFKFAMNFHKRQYTVQNRERNLVDLQIGGTDGPVTQSWVDVHVTNFDDEYSDIEAWDLSRQIRAHLKTASNGRSDSRCDLLALFNEIERHVEVYGKYDATELMETFSVTRTTIHNWLERLRVEIDKVVRSDVD